ncbi:MAG: hypothetical protein K2Y71_08755 [Xanthobacteraceae bacterium]|nr:hypothetical protein [Xanthobacteraceae bacterium]
MQGLMRLAGWGVAATAALLFVVIAANSGSGRERLSNAFAGINGTRAAEAAKAEALQAAQLARLVANEGDTRRLTEIVRSLAGDRERLLARLATIERGLEDVTGSINKQAAATPPAAPPSPPPSLAGEVPPKIASVPPQTAVPAAPATPLAAEPPNRTTAPPPAAVPDLEAIPGRPAAGVDVGGAKDFDGLRTLWNTITSNHFGLFDGLHPIVAVRENNKSRTAELRLVAGPLNDVEIASRICTTLAAAKRYCRLVTFEGQPLALHGEPPRRQGAKNRPLVRAP